MFGLVDTQYALSGLLKKGGAAVMVLAPLGDKNGSNKS